MSDVTNILKRIDDGDPTAAEQLLPLVYGELRRLAGAKLAHEKPGQTLGATALVHEAWLRLVPTNGGASWNGRNHFLAAAAQAMRRILVDRARQKLSVKRGEGVLLQRLGDEDIAEAAPPGEILAVHEALEGLGAEDPVCAEVVKLRYFGGYSMEETAVVLNLSRATAYRLWTYARAWLLVALQERRPEE